MKKILFFITFTTFTLMANNNLDGKSIFLNNCAICHSIDGKGNTMGPDLNLPSYNRTKKQLRKYVTQPDRNFRDFGYSSASMPTIVLQPDEIDAVVNFVDQLQPFKAWMKK